jgi:hypothetical protein
MQALKYSNENLSEGIPAVLISTAPGPSTGRGSTNGSTFARSQTFGNGAARAFREKAKRRVVHEANILKKLNRLQ